MPPRLAVILLLNKLPGTLLIEFDIFLTRSS